MDWPWSDAPMTDSATHIAEGKWLCVIAIQREHFAEWSNRSWEDLCEAAFAGHPGLAPWRIAAGDYAPREYAFMREGTRRDRSLVGRALLYSQGW